MRIVVSTHDGSLNALTSACARVGPGPPHLSVVSGGPSRNRGCRGRDVTGHLVARFTPTTSHVGTHGCHAQRGGQARQHPAVFRVWGSGFRRRTNMSSPQPPHVIPATSMSFTQMTVTSPCNRTAIDCRPGRGSDSPWQDPQTRCGRSDAEHIGAECCRGPLRVDDDDENSRVLNCRMLERGGFHHPCRPAWCTACIDGLPREGDLEPAEPFNAPTSGG